MPLPPYIYTTLSDKAQTRILHLQPSLDRRAPLQCNLQEIDIKADPFYDALSYTWSDQDFTEDLIVDNISLKKITANLNDALRRFRLPLRVRRIWVDAVCINQQDDVEKARQIQFMSQIYRRATSVLAWLGNDFEGALCMRELDKFSRLDQDSYWDATPPIVDPLLYLPWFSRRWIIQEAVLNSNVTLFCASFEIQWIRLLRVLRHVEDNYWVQQQRVGRAPSEIFPYEAIEEVWRSFALEETDRSKPTKTHIMQLLQSFYMSGCQDGRDRIYALVGLAHNVLTGDLTIDVNYTKPVEQVYVDFAYSLLTRPFPVAYLFLRHNEERSDGSHLKGTSSWAPDWRLPILRNRLWQIAGALDHTGRSQHTHFWENFEFDTSSQTTEDTLLIQFPEPVYNHGIIEEVSRPFPSGAAKEAVASWVQAVWYLTITWLTANNHGHHLNNEEKFMLAVQMFLTICGPEDYTISSLFGVNPFIHEMDTEGKKIANMLFNLAKDDFGHISSVSSSRLLHEFLLLKKGDDIYSHIERAMWGRTFFISPPSKLVAEEPRRWPPLKRLITRGKESVLRRPELKWPLLGIGPSHATCGDRVYSVGDEYSIVGKMCVGQTETYGFLFRPLFRQEARLSDGYKGFFIGESYLTRLIGVSQTQTRDDYSILDKESRNILEQDRHHLPQVKKFWIT